ncbi:MAG TPA: hypothetical protein PK385_01515 [Spirochaetota bacterium]|nr:hypothetical protein [Spirochaetota bacterium]HOS32659.1 hypothetical protein [Spirochaetota bacterium]HOS54714.1 hypothetical protein [Spirochaetota bacterium]HQF76608.1 hypothetical protein [Spirochaetota bacterium]HQH30086.1 hypothetical protein [Spirochaetota bacterium]
MIKQIKFNLFMDNKPVRTIEELRENFNFSDLIDYFRNGILRRWLSVRNLNDYIVKIDAIKTDDDLIIAEELVKIFYGAEGVSAVKEKIKESVYPIIYEKKKKDDLKIFEEKKYSHKQIIENYHSDYKELLSLLKERKEDYSFLKTTISKIHDEYLGIFEYHVRDFYFVYMYDCPLVILAVLANKNMRKYFLENDLINKDLSKYRLKLIEILRLLERIKQIDDNAETEWQQKQNEEKLLQLVKEFLGVNLNKEEVYKTEKEVIEILYLLNIIKIKGKATNQYWIDLEDKGKEFMIIDIEEGNFVRNFGNTSEQLGAKEVNNNFPILNGINYMSNNENHKLIYMEI